MQASESIITDNFDHELIMAKFERAEHEIGYLETIIRGEVSRIKRDYFHDEE